MESLPRRFHSRKLSSATNASFSAKNVYNDVFAGGGVPKFGAPVYSSRIEDYGEIFGGSRASSIPILDVSSLDEANVSADVRSSKLDYSKIFGGFRDGDLGASYEEMFAKPNGAKKFSVGTRAPAKTVSQSDGSDRLNHYREEAFQNEVPNQSSEGLKQFNMSYHITSQRSNDEKNGTTRIAQLHAVPGFTYFIDGNPPLQKKKGDKSLPPPKLEVASPPKVYANAAEKPAYDGTGKSESQSSRNKFYSVTKSSSVNDLKTPSSKMSSPSSVPASSISNNSVPTRSVDSNSKVPKSDASGAGPGYCSPSSSDEELDVNSAAAASAAALRKALETAQASIRIAKEFMERRKGTQRFPKSSSVDCMDINNRTEDKVTAEKTRIREKNAKIISECDDIIFQVFSKSEKEKARRSGKVAPDLKETEEISIIKEVVQETNGNKLESAEASGALRQVCGIKNRGECRTAALPCEHVGGRKNIIGSVDTHECWRKEMEIEKEILDHPDGSGKKVDEEAQKQEDLEVKLNTLKATRDLKQHVNRLDTAQENTELEENEKAGVAQVDEEPKDKQKDSNVQEKCEKELEEYLEPMQNEEFDSQGVNVNKEEGLDEAQECMVNERKLEDSFGEEHNEKLLEEFFDIQENEKAGVAQVDEEPKDNQKDSNVQEKCDEKELEEFLEPMENEEFDSQGVNVNKEEGLDEAPGVKANNNEEGLEEAQECLEKARNQEDVFGEEQNEKLLDEFFDLKEIEEFESQGVKANNNEDGLDEAQECMENKRRNLEDDFREEHNEKLLEEFLELKDNEEFDSQGVKANSNEGLDEALDFMENERKQEDIFGEEQNEKLLEEFLDLKEDEEFESQGVKVYNDEEGLDEAQECMENEEKLEDIFVEEHNEKLGEFLDLSDNEEFDSQGVKANKNEGLDEAQECMDNERKLEDSFDKEQNEKLKDFQEAESGNRVRKICEQNKADTGLEPSGLRAGYEEAYELESIEKKEHDAHEGDDNGKSVDMIHELDISNKRLTDIPDGEESEEKKEDDSDLAGKENILVDEYEETEKIQRETEGNGTTTVNQEAVQETTDLDSCKWETGESLNKSDKVHRHKQNGYDLNFEETERMSDATQSSWNFVPDETEAAEMEHEVEGKESCSSGAVEHIEMEDKMKDGSEALLFNHNPANICFPDTSYGAKQTDHNGKESELTSTVGTGINESTYDSSVEGEKEGENLVIDMEEVESNFDTAHVRRVRKQWFEMGNKMEPAQPPILFEGEEKTRTDEEIKAHEIVDEVIKNNLDTAHDRRVRKQWFETGKRTEPSQPPSRYKGEEKTISIDQEIKTNQNIEKNVDNVAKTHAVEEKETKETQQKELNREYLRKIDEANKREREKDRMAVERAIREARERAFSEARERAERAAVEKATAEARKRVMTEAREKLEKASAATKSSAEKASVESKLRAERAAVERATVEARERALEKALSQKATSGPREQAERYGTEKVSGVSRENGMRQIFSSSDTKKLDESNGESAERCKARLERNQRTMERAAKALAEKNRRDLLAQKEQAERNRVAETLDVEVKRWSNGKEGNLRALLSTLQYVLGPNSGWQPVSLTEIVTTAAVKKAYRKATLHVHPDKLQQRGATIQQKYICEKVFDLLKAAWNKFNSEER